MRGYIKWGHDRENNTIWDSLILVLQLFHLTQENEGSSELRKKDLYPIIDKIFKNLGGEVGYIFNHISNGSLPRG
jgi:hypothetical protein